MIRILALSLLVFWFMNAKPCTIGIATGKATADGRPLLWKTRDYEVKNNTVYYTRTSKYSFISNITPEYGKAKSWFGVNDKGFSIVNTDIQDFPNGVKGPENGTFLSEALKLCANVKDFINLLDSTNKTGRTTKAVFGVIDSEGGAAIFEVNANHYWMYDANDKSIAPECFLVRTNFTFINGGTHGLERYKRSSVLINSLYKGDSLNVKNILQYEMRDMADINGTPITASMMPDSSSKVAGYFNCSKNICTPYSISAVVIQGVLPNEPAYLTTMWTMLGNPFSSIAIPYWPVGTTPALSSAGADTEKSLYAVSAKLKKWVFNSNDRKSVNIERTLKLRIPLLQAEDSIYLASNILLKQWRKTHPAKEDMIKTETSFAEYAYSKMSRICAILKNKQPEK